MTKAQYQLLEKVFAAEIEGRLFPSKDKRFKVLEEDQHVEYIHHKVGRDRFGDIVVEGWALTHRGRIYYCQWAAKWEEKLLNEYKAKKPKALLGPGGEQSAPVYQPVLPDTAQPGAAVPHRVRRVRKNR